MGSLSISPTRVFQQGGQAQITLGGQYNEMYKYTIYGSNGIDIVDFTGWNGDNRLGSDGGEEPSGLTRFFYTANFLPAIGTYTVTVDFMDSYPSSVSKTFQIVSEADFYKITILNYPSTIRQMDRFNWRVNNAKPGESLTVIENGPVNITRSGMTIEADWNYEPPFGYYDLSSIFEYAGTYTVTCNFSRSSTVGTTITVTPKIYVVYPSNVVATEPFSYSISGGNPNESWTAFLDGPSPANLSGTLDSNGNGQYSNGVIPSDGSYTIIFSFNNSGKFKQNVFASPSTRNGIHSAGSPLYFSEINAEFQIGEDLVPYQNHIWYLKNGDFGNFDTNNLNFGEFYDKKAIDPAVPGSVYYGEPGDYSFIVPLHRNSVTIEAWGGGGGSGSSIKGAGSIVNFPGNYMVAGGGTSSGGGGRRYFSPGGGGGIASGGQTNINGNSGGNDMGAYVKGGTGANAPNGGAGGAGGIQRGVGDFRGDNGQSPGGGGGGRTGMDGSKYPGYGGAGGGGSGAYCATTTTISTGTQINFNVGQGAQDWASKGGNGAVKISWS